MITVLIINNLLFCKLVSKLVTTVTNNLLSLQLIVNETFSSSVISITKNILIFFYFFLLLFLLVPLYLLCI